MESFQKGLSKGYKNALVRLKNPKARVICNDCGHEFLTYPGRYPETCPLCHSVKIKSATSRYIDSCIVRIISGEDPNIVIQSILK